jgi:hypothetical protein
LLSENRQSGPGNVDDSEQVGLDLRSEVVLRHFFDRGAVGISGIVDHNIEPAELRDGDIYSVACGSWVGHV